MQKCLFVATVLCGILNATHVPVANNTQHLVKVLILYLPRGEITKVAGNALAELFTGKKKDKIEILEDRFGKKMYGFEGNFGKENRKYFKSIILKPQEKKLVAFKSNDCVRKVKVWIVEEQSITADQINSSIFSSNSTLGAVHAKALADNKLQAMIDTKQPVTYFVYNPTLGENNSWQAVTNNRNKNDCDPTIQIAQQSDKLVIEVRKK